MNHGARLTLVSALLAGVAVPAAAQQPGPQPAEPTEVQEAAAEDEDDVDQEMIIVTGTRTPKAVDKVPGAITVISQAEVDRSLTITEDQTAVLAKSVPGYSESNQTANTLGQTLRGRVALYLFDGIPQSTPLRDGSRNASFTDLAVVERIEVISGASASEGIGAAGGVVNYISKRATREGLHFNVGGRFGTQFHDDSESWKLQGDIAYKGEGFDVFAAAAYLDRGVAYDARGRRIGLSSSFSLADTRQVNFFAKVGTDFGADDAQRLELTGSYFRLEGKGNYHYVAGNRALGLPDTSEPGPLLVNGQDITRQEFNDFKQVALNYRHSDLLGGSLVATAYFARQAMRFAGENGDDRQDPQIAPLGTLVDQSEINSKKYGLRTSYTYPDLLLDGLEVRFGVDAVYDETEQRLALTDRVWVPLLKYTSFGPYLQLSYDIGPVTLTGGLRHEDGEIKVDDYTTTYFRNRVFVEGGTLEYKNDLLNAGAIVRIGGGFSAFASYSEGFTLPNVGIPLRNVNTPGQSVQGILDLQAVIFENKEIGLNWRSNWGNAGISYYRSFSELGAGLAVDPVTRDFILIRRPVLVTGIDATAEVRPIPEFRFNALFSHVKGKTTAGNNITTPIDTPMGIVNIAPDKLNLTATWLPTPDASISLGMDRLFARSLPEINERTTGRTLFDLTAKYRVAGVGEISLGVENLFNKYYFLAFSQIDFFQNYFAGRGRVVSLNLRSDF
jgi:iron complex outermembrane receptor protein